MATTPCKIPGITYDATYVSRLASSMSLLAGAFNLPSTKPLWNLYATDPHTKPILDAWVDERPNHPLSKIRAVTPAKLMNLAADPSLQGLITGTTHPAFRTRGYKMLEKDTMLFAVVHLWYLVRLMKAKPDFFPRSVVAGGQLRLDAYDVLHGFKFLKWLWWYLVHRGMPKAARDRKAQRPIYHYETALFVDGGSESEGGDDTVGEESGDEDGDEKHEGSDGVSEDTEAALGVLREDAGDGTPAVSWDLARTSSSVAGSREASPVPPAASTSLSDVPSPVQQATGSETTPAAQTVSTTGTTPEADGASNVPPTPESATTPPAEPIITKTAPAVYPEQDTVLTIDIGGANKRDREDEGDYDMAEDHPLKRAKTC
ncbi:hypothetical protein BJY04DRAFT_213377 [Aspergillus karnatakaensis]|uniref:uncharacterized protein n=1 Tax=Aspergillus karnatakaensis TaxID=1810916 RepID=UPI003CCCB682